MAARSGRDAVGASPVAGLGGPGYEQAATDGSESHADIPPTLDRGRAGDRDSDGDPPRAAVRAGDGSHGLWLVPSKLVPIPIDDACIVRERVLARFAPVRPLTLVSAMSGAGKSVAVRHWCERFGSGPAWVNVDALDEEPVVFWTHLLAAVQSVHPDLVTESQLLLRERGPTDRVFLAALIAELESVSEPVLVVLDGLARQLDRHTLDGLALLVDRAHEHVRVVITTQVDPALPLGRWRTAGWVTEIREDTLKFDDSEAIQIGRVLHIDLADEDLVELNHAIDGWPIALRLALAAGSPVESLRLGEWPESDRSIAARLTSELLAAMPEVDRDTALALSVLDRIDPATCVELVGVDGSQSVRSLLDRASILQIVDHGTGTMQFHPLVRRLLEAELGWRDPVRRTMLHRRAAHWWRARGDMRTAFRHLAAIGELGQARELIVDAAFEIVGRGDLASLRELVGQLPVAAHVTDVDFALELGLVAAWGDGTVAARRWCEHAQRLAAEQPGDDEGRTSFEVGIDRMLCMLATMDADLRGAVATIEAMPLPPPGLSGRSVDAHVAYVMTRALLATGHPLTRDWVERVTTFDVSPMVANVTVPTLRAWSEWLDGRLDRALERSTHALHWLDAHHIDAHHWGFDTFVTAGWCHLSIGDVDEARRLARRAEIAAEAIPCAWNRLQAAFLAGRAELVAGHPHEALRIVDDVQLTVPFEHASVYPERLLHLAAEAAIAVGRMDRAAAFAAEMSPGHHLQLLRARIEPLSDSRLDAVLADRADWPASARIQADVILATRSRSSTTRPELVELVEEAGASGWVLPFFGLGSRVERALRSLPLDRLHPRLAATLSVTAPPPSDASVPRLTDRELALLELLPTHLSYADMGERLYLSVNTVKSNLKGLYRKLDAHTRAEAVAAGQAHGLI